MAGVFNLELQDDPELDEELTDEEFYSAESQHSVSKGDNWASKLVVTFLNKIYLQLSILVFRSPIIYNSILLVKKIA